MDDLTLTAPVDAQTLGLSPSARRVLSDIEEYWHDLGRAKRIPFRSEVDPARIDVALPHAFILQRVARGTGRVRVAGSRIDRVLGLDPRGMPLTAFFTPTGRATVSHWFAEVFDRPAIVELPLVAPRAIGRPRLTGAMILLPLAADDGTVSMAMGALVTEGVLGRGSRRFDVPDGTIRISPVELAAPAVATVPAPPEGSASREHKTSSREPVWPQTIVRRLGPLAGPAADAPEARRHLRLVVDNG